jgi:3-hydroxyacyl-CoA dehydrogenase
MSNEGEVTLERRGSVAVLTIDHPPVNALSPTVFRQLGERIQEVVNDDEVEVVVLTGAGKNFSAGMDLTSVEDIPGPDEIRKSNPLIYSMMEMMEDSPKPVVAALKGNVLGGGLEFAMPCHYRIADETVSLGQPEVNVGLIPGAGGTQRLPRLIGLPDGIQMVCGGRPIKAQRALELGLVDKLTSSDRLLDDAIDFALERAKAGGPHPKTRERADKVPPAEMLDQIFQMAQLQVKERAGHFIAPLKALEAVEASIKGGYEKGIEVELEKFIECMFGEQAQAMIHLFFAQRATTRVPEFGDLKSKARPVKCVAVIGGGLMGRDIAFVHLQAGKDVLLVDVGQEQLDAAVEVIQGHFQRRVNRGRLTKEEMDECLARLRPTIDYADIADVDVVIEAVFEKMDLKKQILSKLNETVSREAVIASNTSTLPISELARAVDGQERVIGLHFFSPARVMPLLEMVRTDQTSEETIATSFALAKEIRKTPVLVKDCYGFLANRTIWPYSQEATRLVEEGASVQQVDEALVEFGMRMGPFTMADMAGLDIGAHAAPGMMKAYPEKFHVSPIGKKLYEMGRYGQKVGKGYYKYEEGKREGVPDPDVDKIIEGVRKEMGIEPREISTEEILERTLYAWVNECAYCLEEGVALKPSDVDIATVMGFGFPPWRGGLMLWAKAVGYKKISDALAKYAEKYDGVYKPSPWLTSEAASS